MSEHKNITANTSCWIVTEGMAGTENQCLGVTDALGVTPVVKRIGLRFPWKQLVPAMTCFPEYAFSSDSDPLDPPYPDLLITSGRKAIPASLMIKKLSGGKTKTVHIQDPRTNPALFDLVIVPQHDPTRGSNVLVTTGALHRVTPTRIEDAAQFFKTQFKHIPHPCVAVMIGGTSKAHTMTHDIMRDLCDQLKSLHASGYGLLVTASRRTGIANQRMLRKEIAPLPNAYLWDGGDVNPYFAYLHMADFIMVTEDSVSMTSEAISTGKPVYTIPLDGGGKRLDTFHNLLQTQGHTRLFDGLLETWHTPAPQDTKIAAQRICDLFKT